MACTYYFHNLYSFLHLRITLNLFDGFAKCIHQTLLVRFQNYSIFNFHMPTVYTTTRYGTYITEYSRLIRLEIQP